MENPRGPASFMAQTDALFRKNWALQKRRKGSNCRLILFPFLLCLCLAGLNFMSMKEAKSQTQGEIAQGEIACTPASGLMDDKENGSRCLIRNPPENPPLLQIPNGESRAVRTAFLPFGDLPDKSCRRRDSCPVTILVTGNNKSLALDVAENLLPTPSIVNSSNVSNGFSDGIFGSMVPKSGFYVDPAFSNKSPSPILNIQRRCKGSPPASIPIVSLGVQQLEIRCVRGLTLWRNSSSEINDELFQGYWNGNSESKTNEIVAAYDLLNSNKKNYNVSIWYNSTTNRDDEATKRIARSVNLVSNAYLESLRGPDFQILFEFIKEMPKHATIEKMADFSTEYGTLFFTWVVLQLFPVISTYLVYEKQENIRMMMKMHGLGDGPYWMISYAYFLALSSAYMLCFVGSCLILGLEFFTAHDKLLQFVFYFVYLNFQIAFSFLVSRIFSKVRTASVVGYLLVFATALLGMFYFGNKVNDPSFPRIWIVVMELYPGLALYRMFYEFSVYSQQANFTHSTGMEWEDLKDSTNGMNELLIIMIVEWFVLLFVLYLVENMSRFSRRKPSSSHSTSLSDFDEGKADVAQERAKVDALFAQPNTHYSIICDNIRKVYPAMDGNPPKEAVKGLSLALPRGECFGMLGPNGAGKSSFIKMMIGLTKPSSGRAFVQGIDIQTDMGQVYPSMGVCPQHDLLWETLTAREHLFFYGRLKNLKGSALHQAVEESLRGVNLLTVADKQAGKYSGGMKRRLSVAISLIGDPKVVYMDEPSTGLDPASRKELWDVVMRAKVDRAILLTTHSMEEAEHLCDRLGIFVDGSLQCIGNAKQLKARYGGSYIFTMTTAPKHEQEVEDLVFHLSPNANRTYHISGTQKFDLPKNEVKISDVFEAVEIAQSKFPVQAWGLVNTTLEDVFINVARGAEAFKVTEP